MITLNDVVVVKENGKLVCAPIPFARVYLEYGPEDKVVETDSKVTSKDGDKIETLKVPVQVIEDAPQVEGKLWSGSVVDSNELFAQTISHLQEKYPTTDPLWKLLSLASGQYSLDQRKPLRDDVAPKNIKRKDPNKALAAIAQNLVAGGMAKDLAAAYEFLKASGIDKAA